MHVTVYLICALVTALMAAYGIWRTIRIAHLGTTSKLAVTAFFALAGASLQGVFRNPLVDPHIIGVTAGAAFG